MKIAYIYPEQLPSRKARAVSVLNTVRALAPITETGLFYEKSSGSDKLDLKKVKAYPLSRSLLGFRSNKIFNHNLYEVLKKEHFDIYYVRHLKTADFLLKRKPAGVKLIFECHEIFHSTNPETREFEERIYPGADGLVFINASLQKEFGRVFEISHVPQAVINNGCSFDAGYVKKDFSFIDRMYYIGNFYPWKGVDIAVKVTAHIPDIVLNIIGEGNRKKELQNLASDLGIEKRVLFMGYKSHEEIKNLLMNAKLTLIPNGKSVQNLYSTPIKLYEYMATSNIIIASDMPAIREVICDGENGFLFETGNIESFAETLRKVLSMPPEKLRDVAAKAYETSREFTWEKRAEKIVKFAGEVAG